MLAAMKNHFCSVAVVNQTGRPLTLVGEPVARRGKYTIQPPRQIAAGGRGCFRMDGELLEGPDGSCVYQVEGDAGDARELSFSYSCPVGGANKANAEWSGVGPRGISVRMIPNPLPAAGHPVQLQFTLQAPPDQPRPDPEPPELVPFMRSSHPGLALWQSLVAKKVRENLESGDQDLNPLALHQKVLLHPMALGANMHVAGFHGKGPLLEAESIRHLIPRQEPEAAGTARDAPLKTDLHPAVHGFLSRFYFEQAMAEKKSKAEGGKSESDRILEELPLWKKPHGFPDSDYALQWAEVAAEWYLYANPEPGPYVDWRESKKNLKEFGVYTIPEDSTLLILGDYGTGLPDATMMLMAILSDASLCPDFILHLGDIYYAGNEHECEAYTETFARAFEATGRALPVFSLPGNHEYMTGGTSFFRRVLPMNLEKFPQYVQEASYFCLRTASGNWQLLGMDTGLNSVKFSFLTHSQEYYSPWLHFSEAEWHKDKLESFDGKSILMSHHQLFTVSSKINDGRDVSYLSGTDAQRLTYLNGNLLDVFQPYFGKVAAWFWGHEHILGYYEDGQERLKKGRLVGNSGYEEWDGEDAYQVGGGPYRYQSDPPATPGTTAVLWPEKNPLFPSRAYRFYNHAFALLRLKGGNASVEYYEYPVAAPDAKIPPLGELPPPRRLNLGDEL